MNTIIPAKTNIPDLVKSEERLRFAMDISNHGIWDWNIETGEIYFSASWKAMLGFDEHEISNNIEEWKVRIHPDDRAQLAHDLNTHFNSSNPVHENCYRLKAKDGNYRWIQGRGKIVEHTPDGTPLRMIGTHTDITWKKESEEQYRNLFNITPLPTWIYDFDTLQFLAVNEAAIGHYGYTRDEFLAMSIADIRPKACLAMFYASLPNREKQAKATYTNWKHCKKNGDVIVVELNTTTVYYNGRKARLVVVNDITKKVAAEEELRQSHQRFLYASKATSDAIYDMDIATGNLAWGEGLTTLFGYSTNEMNLAQWERHVHPDERQAVVANLNQSIYESRKKFWKCEYRFRKADGTYRFVREKGFILRDEQNKPLRMIGAIQDITDLKQKQLELAESNKRYEYATMATSDIVWDWVFEKRCVLWSENYEKLMGWPLPDSKCIPIKTCMERFHESDRSRLQTSLKKAFAQKEQHVWDAELKYLKQNGDVAHTYNRAYILRAEDGSVVRMIGAMQDITERKKLEAQLLQEELDKQKVISKATIDTQERERTEIGKELHDNVNQVLTTTKLYLELAQSRVELRDNLLQKSEENIVYVINEIRQLSQSLMNPSLGDLGIVDAIRDLVENIRATQKLKVVFEADECCWAGLSTGLELTLYRIAQEALNNAVKHANATAVFISLRRKQHNLELIIQDDGIGFNPELTKRGAGLNNMQNRVYLANGTLEIQSHPGAGCTLTIQFNT